MALVDPYSPCPCGSDKKFKWCCQKVEAYAERAHRLEDNGQHNAALAAYDEGLAKVPRNPWLLLRKSVLLIELQKLDEAKRCVATVLQYQPDHLGASVLLCRLVLATEGPAAAVAELQRVALARQARSAKAALLDHRDRGERAGQGQLFPGRSEAS